MKLYKIKDIFDLANATYNLKIDPKKDKAETQAIKRAIRRELIKQGEKAPFEETLEKATYLINNLMKNYFMKKSAKANPSLTLDADTFAQMQQQGLPSNLTFEQAEINCKLDFLIHLLVGELNGKQIYFERDDFKKAYTEYRKHLDVNGYPMPGYTAAKSNLLDSQRYFKQV